MVGASNDPTKYGNWISAQALAARDARPVYLVNRRGDRVLGEPTYRLVSDIGEPVDLVVLAVPAAGFEAAVDDALAAGAEAIVAITAGFAELGEEGAARQAAVVERVRAAGAVLLGPNCLGVADTAERLQLATTPMPAGAIGLISQSGNVALELGLYLEERGVGISRFASLGNQADLTAADLLHAYATHPGTEAIGVYCEDFLDGRAFARAAHAAVEAGTPVVLLSVGASGAAVRSARSHTGALTSDAAVVGAACRAAGVDRVHSVREMADLLAALPVRPRGRRVAVIADGGGHASLASDLAEAHGLDVPAFGPSLASALRETLPPSAGTTNPVDVAGAGEQDVGVFARTLDLVLSAPDADAALVTGWFGAYGEYGPAMAAAEIAAAEAMAAGAGAHRKPVALHTLAPESAAAAVLRAAGIPVFRALDDAVRTLALLAAGAGRPARGVPALPEPAPPVAADDHWTARELLRAAGVPFAPARRVAGADEAVAAAAELGGAVALKALGLLHKSDAGGVALGLATEADLRAAHAAMTARLAPPAFVVERMADTRDGVELIAGVRRDPRFGPVVMVGLGGLFTEALHDVAFALAPVEADDVPALLDALAGAPLLRGARGRPPVDVAAVARAVAAIAAVAAAHPEIAELEVNPLLARPDGCVALDARLVPTTRS